MDHKEIMGEMEKTEHVSGRKPGKVANFFFCLAVIAAVIAVQVAVTVAGMVCVAVVIRMQNMDSVSKYMQEYTEFIQNSSVTTWLELAAVLGALVLVVPWYYFGFVRKAKKAGQYESVLPRLKNVKSIAFLIFGSISCFSIGGVLEVIAMRLMPGVAEWLEQTLVMMINGNILVGMISLILLAPICEEIAVRGIILQHSRRVYGLVGCMLLSTFFFSIFHMNPIQGLYVLPMGLFWAYVGYRFNSVIPCILCHMINNCLGTFLGELLDPFEHMWIYLILFVVFGAITVWIGTKEKNALQQNRT